jgi:dihydrosphingosine 1-phosphate phosphatase
MPGALGNGPNDWAIWTLIATLKVSLGVLAVFSFRLVAKPTLQLVLPPIFRFLAQIFTLPTRRWYTPATEYKTVPLENLNGLSAIPSVIDLPTALATSHESSHSLTRMAAANGLKRRKVDGTLEKSTPQALENPASTAGDEESTVRHYDADGKRIFREATRSDC